MTHLRAQTRDVLLDDLADRFRRGETLPSKVTTGDEEISTRDFLNSFARDQREASSALANAVDLSARPWVGECALTIAGHAKYR